MPDKKIQNILEYIGFRALIALFMLLPEALRQASVRGLLYVGYLLGIRRSVAEKQLSTVFPDCSLAERKRIVKGVYKNMADSTFEMYLIKDQSLLQRIDFIRYDYMEEAMALGRGAILATAHFGSWESARVMPMKKIPLCVITKRQRNRIFDAYTNKIRIRNGLKIIDMRRGLRDLIKHLMQKRIVAILMDQNAGGSGLMLDFMGFPASHWKGVAKLSLRYQVPIVPGFAPREANGRIRFEFFPMILHPELEDREENYPTILNEINAILEKMIRRYPEQWFWVHKRWKHGYEMF